MEASVPVLKQGAPTGLPRENEGREELRNLFGTVACKSAMVGAPAFKPSGSRIFSPTFAQLTLARQMNEQAGGAGWVQIFGAFTMNLLY